jgi:hypothetical protein
MTTVWLHTHLPRLRSGDPDPISVKVPGQRIAYAAWVSLRNAEFRVSESGRQRCILEGVRNVHAWVVGEEVLRTTSAELSGNWLRWLQNPPKGYRKAVYDPFKGSSFVDSETFEPVREAEFVIVSGKNVYYV